MSGAPAAAGDLPVAQIICGIPELGAHCGAGVSHVLSILDPDEPEPDAFARYPEHERLTLRFHDVLDPGPGLVLPAPEHVAQLLAFGARIGREGLAGLLIHCHMGISRSTAAAASLIAQAWPELEEDAVFAHIVGVRPIAWPNSLMIRYADEQLGRGGRFSAALVRLHARRTEEQPRFAAEMARLGRGAEFDAALAG